MKHLKFYTLIVLCMLFLFSSVACNTTKKAVTTEEFISKTTELGYEQIDMELPEDLQAVIKDSAFVYEETEDTLLICEFYTAKNSSSAQAIVSGTKKAAEDLVETKTTTVSKSGSNFSYYKISNNNIVCILSNVDNTIVYIRADKTLEDKADLIIKTLGY